jgi:hypothetical protein
MHRQVNGRCGVEFGPLLVDANRVEMRRLPFRHINRRKEETEPLSACIDRD